MLNRRLMMIGTLFVPTFLALTRSANADNHETSTEQVADTKEETKEGELPDELTTSKLVYMTVIKSDGDESKCKAEIWFMFHDGAIFVVTPTDAWRTEAIRKELTNTRIWVGEFGNWQRANEKYREAPEIMATGSIEEDKEVHAEVLEAMGEKYSDEWSTWGPRFKSALEDGSRAMLRYTPDS